MKNKITENHESYDVNNSHIDSVAEINRLAAQAHSGWNKESRNLELFGLKNGMDILEIGSGPGFTSKSILSLCPNSYLTCVDIDINLLDHARKYLAKDDRDRVHLVQSSALDMPFENDSFDFAYARLVLQHLSDPIAAVKEIRRVLKPGGVLVIYDIDDGVNGIIEPEIELFQSILEIYGKAQSAYGGNRKIARSLWRILSGVGYINLDMEVIAIHSEDVGLDCLSQQIDPDRLIPLVKHGFLSENDFEGVKIAHNKFMSAKEKFILNLVFMIGAKKP